MAPLKSAEALGLPSIPGAIDWAIQQIINILLHEECEPQYSEIALVVDSSWSMSGSHPNTPPGNWNNTKTWMKNMVDVFQIDGEHHRAGLIQWNSNIVHSATVLFSENLTGEEMKAHIDGLPEPSGGTLGGQALEETFATLFQSQGDPEVYQNVIFLSDGQSQDDIVGPAANFWDNGIRVTSIALGQANLDNMEAITGINRNPPLPYENYFFSHTDAAGLLTADEQIWSDMRHRYCEENSNSNADREQPI